MPANGTAVNETCESGLCSVNGTVPNGTANLTPTLALSTPSETVTAVNITPYGTPTPPRSLPAPVGALFAALVGLGLFARLRSR